MKKRICRGTVLRFFGELDEPANGCPRRESTHESTGFGVHSCVAGLPRACAETLPPVAHFFWRCFRRTGAGDKVSDDPAALNAAGRFLSSGPEAFLKTLGFCLTLSFSVSKLQTHSIHIYIHVSTVSANILHVENIVHVDKLALE